MYFANLFKNSSPQYFSSTWLNFSILILAFFFCIAMFRVLFHLLTTKFISHGFCFVWHFCGLVCDSIIVQCFPVGWAPNEFSNVFYNFRLEHPHFVFNGRCRYNYDWCCCLADVSFRSSIVSDWILWWINFAQLQPICHTFRLFAYLLIGLSSVAYVQIAKYATISWDFILSFRKKEKKKRESEKQSETKTCYY